MDVFLLTIYGNLLFEAIPFVLLITHYNRLPDSFKWLAVILGWSLTADIGSEIAYHLSIDQNLIINAYLLIATGLVSSFFNKVLNKSKIPIGLKVLNITYILFALINILVIQKSAMNTYTQVLLAIVVLILSISFYYKLMKDLPAQQLHKMSLFWVVSGMFFASSGKLVIYGVSHYLIHYLNDDLAFIWPIHNVLSIISNSIIIVGIWIELSTPFAKA